MSQAEAARTATQLGGKSFSHSAWTKYESGETAAPVGRLVIMAMVVGVTANDLEQAGEPQAAQLLRDEVHRRAVEHPALTTADTERTPEALLQMIIQGLEEIRALGLTSDQTAALEESLVRNVRQNIATQIDQIRTVMDPSRPA